jgi:hypothetical protein
MNPVLVGNATVVVVAEEEEVLLVDSTQLVLAKSNSSAEIYPSILIPKSFAQSFKSLVKFRIATCPPIGNRAVQEDLPL